MHQSSIGRLTMPSKPGWWQLLSSVVAHVRAGPARGQASLRTHLILLVLGAVIPLLIFTIVLVAQLVGSQREDIDAALRSNAHELATAVDRKFETAIAALQVLGQSPLLQGAGLERFYELAETVRRQRQWGTVVLLAADGSQVLNLLLPLGAKMPNVGTRAYFKEVLRTRQPVVSDLYQGSISGRWVVTVAVPVIRGGDLTHVLLGVMYADDMQELVAGGSLGPEWTRALLDPNGVIVARTAAPDYTGRKGTPDFLARIAQSREGSYTATAVDGVDRFGAFARAPLSGWTAAVAVPASLVQGALRRSLMTTAVGGGTVLLIGVLLARVLGRRIARDMSAATVAAETLAVGGGTVLPRSTVTEVGRLGAALEKSALLLEQRDQERKQAYVLEADARREAEAANEAKDHFLAVLSHELRTPLAPVLNGLALLEREQMLSGRGRELLATIRRNVQTESQLIDDLLDVTRIARGKLELERCKAELCAIIDRALDVCRADIEARGLDLRLDLGPRPYCYFVEADAARLQQVFWNLLQNAIKFTPASGTVEVRCRLEDGHVLVDVSDSGIGIEPSALERIFDPFAQAERSLTRKYGGLGLGLAISKALVNAHGGSIGVRSEGQGRGATFTVRLPVVAGEQSEPKPVNAGPAASAAASRGGLHILLVEDHSDTAEITRLLLEMAGYRVSIAGSVSAALELAERDRFDLLVSDIGLPDGTGIDLMRALRSQRNMLPGIAVSGFGYERDVEGTRSAGFVDHLVKPVDPEHLLQALATHAASRP